MAPTRWTYTDPALLALFPATYVAHLVEEWLAPASVLLWTLEAEPGSGTWFVAGNAAGVVLMLTAVRLVRRGPRFHWIAPALAVAVLLNTVGHVAGAAQTSRYSAGMVSAVALWVPLGLLTLVRAWDQADRRTLMAGVIAGMLVELSVVGALALNAR